MSSDNENNLSINLNYLHSNLFFFFTMNKIKIFYIFKFRQVNNKQYYPLTNNVDIQSHNDQLVDNTDPRWLSVMKKNNYRFV